MSETKTKWDSIVCDDDLSKAKALRAKTYTVSKERRVALPELIEEGWEEYKSYKNNKFVGVRKNKNTPDSLSGVQNLHGSTMFAEIHPPLW